MKRMAGAGLSALLLALIPMSAVNAQERQADPHNRLFIRFVEDAVVEPHFWLEGQLSLAFSEPAFDEAFRGGGEANLLQLTPVFAFNVAEDFEFGGRVGIVYRDPDNGGSDSGLTDTDIWGKLSISTDPVRFTLGILLDVPTANEDDFLGTGEINVEFFGGIRKDWNWGSISGNAGFRINQDPDFSGFELEGETSFLAGVGALFPVSRNWTLTAEWAYETERYDGVGSDSRILGGFDLSLNESMMVRGAVAFGLSKGAPGTQALGSFVWLF